MVRPSLLKAMGPRTAGRWKGTIASSEGNVSKLLPTRRKEPAASSLTSAPGLAGNVTGAAKVRVADV